MSDQQAFDSFLLKSGLRSATEEARFRPLAGGVSSDICRVDLPGRSICIKRALPKLRVSADWEAPVSRSAFEWEWLSFVAAALPDNVPEPLAYDSEGGVFAMQLLDPDRHPVWKELLLGGEVDPAVAAAVGRVIGRIHAASARHAGTAERFDSGDNFQALRLEPYLIATAAAHPEIAGQLNALAERTAATKRALVHGDVSPKNVLVGPKGPVLLDAECAWFGDPAFDLAFCLNHLLLKCLAVPGKAGLLRASFDALREAYLREVVWEPPDALEARAAGLLPALFLARIDGKSPVEYVTREDQRDAVRDCAVPLVRHPVARLQAPAEAWFSRFAPWGGWHSGPI